MQNYKKRAHLVCETVTGVQEKYQREKKAKRRPFFQPFLYFLLLKSPKSSLKSRPHTHLEWQREHEWMIIEQGWWRQNGVLLHQKAQKQMFPFIPTPFTASMFPSYHAHLFWVLSHSIITCGPLCSFYINAFVFTLIKDIISIIISIICFFCKALSHFFLSPPISKGSKGFAHYHPSDAYLFFSLMASPHPSLSPFQFASVIL